MNLTKIQEGQKQLIFQSFYRLDKIYLTCWYTGATDPILAKTKTKKTALAYWLFLKLFYSMFLLYYFLFLKPISFYYMTEATT